jgi:hypothetical protein
MCNDPLIKHPLWLMDVDFDCESELTFENGILVPLTKFERFCVVSFLVCLPLGRPLGWPAGVSSILSMGEQPPSVWQTRGPHKVLQMCSRFAGTAALR